jgi:cytosine/adenosine deaminase-related metal-dependent hydrolase
MTLLQADWVLPISGPPLHLGAVVVQDGEIVAVGDADHLRSELWAEPVIEFPGCVLMPGLVNTHTHLEYSAFQGLLAPGGFGRWMLGLLRARRKLDLDDYAASALWGAHECARSGVTCIADTTYEGWIVGRAAAAAGLRARVYVEAFGLDDSQLPAAMERLEERVDKLREECGPGACRKTKPRPPGSTERHDRAFSVAPVALLAHVCATLPASFSRACPALPEGGASFPDRLLAGAASSGAAPSRRNLVEAGVSPHAPYTVSARLYREVARFARHEKLNLATHLAESQAEVDLLTGKKNPITRAYQAANLWTGQNWTPPRLRPVQYLARTGALTPEALAIHVVQADAEDIAALAATGAGVAHCPRSNLRLHCGRAPVADMRAAGIMVGLGTDSLASNDDLDLFAEMRAALTVSRARAAAGAPLPALTPGDVLRMATLEGARALGLDALVGTVEPGKRADLIAVRLSHTPADAHQTSPVEGPTDPTDGGETLPDLITLLVNNASAADVRMTMVDGRVIFDAGEQPAMPPEVVETFNVARKKLGFAG